MEGLLFLKCEVFKDELNLFMNDNFLYATRGDNTQMQHNCFQSNAIGIQEEKNSFMDLPNLWNFNSLSSVISRWIAPILFYQ